MSAKKLTQTNPDVKFLRRLIQNGGITGSDDANNIYESHSRFNEKYKLKNFRLCFNNLLDSMGIERTNKVSLASDNRVVPASSEERRTSSRKRPLESDDEGSDSEEDSNLGDRAELVLGSNYFKPPYLISDWKEAFTIRRCLSIAILLPSGCHKNFKLNVCDDGSVLQVRVIWPFCMSNAHELHRLWLIVEEGRRVSKDHSKIIGFDTALRGMRSSAEDPVYSHANIGLPFRVETEIEFEPLHWPESGAFVIYVDLKASLDSYAGFSDQKEFKDMSRSAIATSTVTN